MTQPLDALDTSREKRLQMREIHRLVEQRADIGVCVVEIVVDTPQEVPVARLCT